MSRVNTMYSSGISHDNSDPKNVDPEDDFFEDLYADYDVQRINAKRKINRNADHRGYITELLIKNY